MYAYFWILICIFFHLYISVCIWRLKYPSLSCFGCMEWAGFEVQGVPSSSPQYTIKALIFWYLKIVLRSYIMPLLQWNLTIWAWQQRDLSRSLDIRYRFPAVLAFQRLPRSRQSWRLQWDQGLGKYLIVYWVISWHRYKPWQNYHHLKICQSFEVRN